MARPESPLIWRSGFPRPSGRTPRPGLGCKLLMTLPKLANAPGPSKCGPSKPPEWHRKVDDERWNWQRPAVHGSERQVDHRHSEDGREAALHDERRAEGGQCGSVGGNAAAAGAD